LITCRALSVSRIFSKLWNQSIRSEKKLSRLKAHSPVEQCGHIGPLRAASFPVNVAVSGTLPRPRWFGTSRVFEKKERSVTRARRTSRRLGVSSRAPHPRLGCVSDLGANTWTLSQSPRYEWEEFPWLSSETIEAPIGARRLRSYWCCSVG